MDDVVYRDKVQIEINGQSVWSYDIQENQYLSFAERMAPNRTAFAAVESINGSTNISSEPYYSYLAMMATGHINAWVDKYKKILVFWYIWYLQAFPEPQESPLVIISSEDNDVNLVYLDGYGNKQVYKPIDQDEVLDSLFTNNVLNQPGNYYEVTSSSQWTDAQYSLSINKNEIEKISETELITIFERKWYYFR